MNSAPVSIAGIPIPSDSPLFLAVVGIHVIAGLAAVITGIVAMLSDKGPGRHPDFGRWYYRSVVLVFISMTVLSIMRWAHDYHLFILGALAFAAAYIGRRTAPTQSRSWIRTHVTTMGLSYILLLTAFYVDNGPNLPLWRHLPRFTYWLLPLIGGAPLIIRALLTHPVIQRMAMSPDTARPNNRWRGP